MKCICANGDKNFDGCEGCYHLEFHEHREGCNALCGITADYKDDAGCISLVELRKNKLKKIEEDEYI